MPLMVSRCPACKTNERIVTVRAHTTARCNSCGDCEIIPRTNAVKKSSFRRHHYRAALLAASSLSILVLLVKVAHALP